MKQISTFLLLVLLLHGCSFSSSNVRPFKNPHLDSILTFQMDPWGENEILLSALDGIYLSTDNSHTWRFLSKQPNINHPIEFLYPHPYKKNTWFGYNSNHVYISRNDGNTWKSYQKGLYSSTETGLHRVKDCIYKMFPTLQPQNIAVFDIAVAQAGTRYVFCGSSKGLYYMDSSQQWKLLLPTLEYGEIIHIVDIPEKELLFCVTSQRKLFGVLYEDLRIIPYASFPYGPIKQLHYSPQQGLIILSDTGIYSSDVSSSDPSILTMSPMYIDENIDILYSNNQKIWITKEDQLLFSDPSEIEWNTTNLPISTRVLSIQYSPTNALTFILSSTQGIFYSYDLQKWVAPETSIQDCNVTSIVQDVVIPTTLYCATLNHGVYQSIDHGITWSTMNEGIEFKSIDCLLSIHEPFHTLYAGTLQDGLYSAYYPDHQWSIQNAVFEKGTITALSPSNNDEQPMLVGIWDPATEQSLLYYSFNSGLQWYPVIFPSRITSIQGFDSNPSMFWIGTNHGLYLWDANTLSYEPTIFTKSITVIQKDDWDEKNLFIGTLQGLYKTNNKGETFQEMSCNYQYNLGKIDDFSFHVVEPHTIMVVSAGQIFQSINKGETWKPIPLPIEYFVTVIYHDAVDPNTLYAGTKDHGVIYTIDSGNHWKISNNFRNP